MKVVFCVYLFLATLLTSCFNQQTAEESKVSDSLKKIAKDEKAAILPDDPAKNLPWAFEETGKGEYDEPLTKVSIVVGEKKVVVAKQVMGNCNVLEPAQWQDYKIPSGAKSACMSWWAGAGDVFYLIQKKDLLLVYHGVIGEGIDLENDLTYEKILEVNNNQR